MYNRYLQSSLKSLCFKTGKMAFISGPRQCGKTTMAKFLLAERGEGVYYNWDEIKFRRLWAKDPLSVIPHSQNGVKPIVILDELHKAKFWKLSLKGVYDSQDNRTDIIVTGSARLNVYRKGSDSLLGRYYHFRLHPFSVAELLAHSNIILPDDLMPKLCALATQNRVHSLAADDIFEDLLKFGPFPEPLLAKDEKILNLWTRNRLEKLIREDLRDLSRLPELSQVEMLASLLPERAAQPLSIRSLSEDLEVAYSTIKRWLDYLNALYYIFQIKPYAKSLQRAIKKEKKLYLWDWSEIDKEGACYENLVAGHLLKYCDYLTDTGYGTFELRYLKDRDKHEIDFLIVKNKSPCLPIEVKYSDETPSEHWKKFMDFLKCSVGVQLVTQKNIFKIYEYETYKIYVMSASSLLQFLI
jgi:uncharacterized protein